VDEAEQVRSRYAALRGRLDERALRLWAATEAKTHGRGGVVLVAGATGMSRQRIGDGLRELRAAAEAPRPAAGGHIRRPGGGRKLAEQRDATLLADLEALVDPATRGHPETPLRWTCKSTARLAAALAEQGHRVDARTVARLLKQQHYSLQANRKTLEGADHPDRDAQFAYISAQTTAFQRCGQPVISVDTKKKELIGPFKQGGREWEPVGQPVEVNVHDFPDPELGKGIPYGVFDVTANQGWVSVGTDHDTPAFAVQSIRSWWQRMGCRRYPQASRLLVMADGGGGNSSRARLWKIELQGLAAELGFPISVCHFPPGTSKWNKIEHRLFCHITENWRGRPLVSHEVIVNLIGSTTTQAGLTVQAAIDPTPYPTGVKVTDEELARVPIQRADFHGEWNYTIAPATPPDA
jgi:hypothetical protein